jgi:hypothetical protein
MYYLTYSVSELATQPNIEFKCIHLNKNAIKLNKLNQLVWPENLIYLVILRSQSIQTTVHFKSRLSRLFMFGVGRFMGFAVYGEVYGCPFISISTS